MKGFHNLMADPTYQDNLERIKEWLKDRLIDSSVGEYKQRINTAVEEAFQVGMEESYRIARTIEDKHYDNWREGHKANTHLEGRGDGAGDVAEAINVILTNRKGIPDVQQGDRGETQGETESNEH